MRRERITITIRNDVIRKIDTIIDGQKIRNRSNAIETIVLERFKNNVLNKAVILAANGRIAFEGSMKHKMLMPVGGETVVEKNLKKLASVGIKEVYVGVDEESEKEIQNITNQSNLGIEIKYFVGKVGTAGILKKLSGKIDSTFLMMNSDILLDNIDVEDFYLFHKTHKADATIAVATSTEPHLLGTIHMKGNFITDFFEKEKATDKHTNLINGGIYMLEPGVCGMVASLDDMVEDHLFPDMAKKGGLAGYFLGNKWTHLHDEHALKKFLNKT